MAKDKKSFKKFASKHLSNVIETRRKTASSRKEMKERTERKQVRATKEAAKEEKEHVDQLERLKEMDPQFYSYLEDEDPTLLHFGQGDEMEIVGDRSGSDDETEEDEPEGAGDSDDAGSDGTAEDEGPRKERLGRVTQTELDTLLGDKKVEPLIDIFMSAVRELGYDVKEQNSAKTCRKFDDPTLVKNCLNKIAKKMAEALPTLLKNGSFRNVNAKNQVRRFLAALVVAVTEGSNDPVLVAALLQAMARFVPVLHILKGQTKSVLKSTLQLCTHQESLIRLAAYGVVRAVATRASGTRTMYQSTAFKGLFLALVKTAHQYNIHNLPTVGFLMSSVVDLYATDMEAAYQHAFVYTRQLAIYLRAALQQQSQANIRAVFNWQYLNALRTWGLVVSSYPDPSQLGPLIHPTVQIALGVMDLFPSPRMFPMHLHVLEMLNHITSRANGVYIPLGPYLLRILTAPSLNLQSGGKADASAKKRNRDGSDHSDKVDLQFTMRVKKSQCRTQEYKISVWKETLFLLTAHLAAHSCAVGFPEAFWPVESTLRKLRKEVRLPKIHSMISTILRHMEATGKKIASKRDQANFGPCDVVAVKMFEDDLKSAGNPLIQYHASLRQQRVDEFAAKQQGTGDRITLEQYTGGKTRLPKPNAKKIRFEKN